MVVLSCMDRKFLVNMFTQRSPIRAFMLVNLFCSIPWLCKWTAIALTHHENMPIYFWPPWTPPLYSKTGVYRDIHYFLLLLLKKIDCRYSLEPSHWGGSNVYLQSMFWAEIWKISVFFLSENVQFFGVNFYIYLNRRVFVMTWSVLGLIWDFAHGPFHMLRHTYWKQNNKGHNLEERTFWHVHPVNTQISIRVCVVHWKKLSILGCKTKCAQWRCPTAQADLNLCWVHMSEGTFSGAAARKLTHS